MFKSKNWNAALHLMLRRVTNLRKTKQLSFIYHGIDHTEDKNNLLYMSD